MLERLHEAEVALGQMHRLVARQGADDGDVEGANGTLDQGAMARAADAVEDHAGDADARIEARKAEHRCCGGLRLPGNVEHEQDRETKADGKLGGGSLADAPSGTPSNSPMADSTMRRSAPADASWRASSSAGPMAQGSRLRHGAPVAAAWKAGSI